MLFLCVFNGLICRLWHQLTKKLFEFFEHPLAIPYRVDTFERFVRDFERRINQLRLVEMGTKVSKDIDSMFTRSHPLADCLLLH